MKLTIVRMSLALMFSILLITITLAAQNASNPVFEGDQATAIGCIRSINTAEVYYDKEYKKGWSPTLASLGGPADEKTKPSASAAKLLDDSLTGGKKANYVFTYKPRKPDASGKINTYILTVRPVKWKKGLWNFFDDETGIIRGTGENRAAKASDPPLQ
jgi:type IV pilus assembly protein PilA